MGPQGHRVHRILVAAKQSGIQFLTTEEVARIMSDLWGPTSNTAAGCTLGRLRAIDRVVASKRIYGDDIKYIRPDGMVILESSKVWWLHPTKKKSPLRGKASKLPKKGTQG